MFGFKTTRKDETIIDILIQNKAKELHILELAMEIGIELIAKTFSKCEIKVIRKIDGKLKEVKDENYYRLNIKPNKNETGTTFWKKAIHKLFHEEEVLIVTLADESMYIANNYTKSADVINGLIFSNVEIESNNNTYRLDRNFSIDECLFFKNYSDKAKTLLCSFQEMYAKLLGVTISSYARNNALKLKATVPGTMSFMKDGEPVTKNQYFEGVKKQLNSEELEILLSSNGLEYDSLNMGNQQKAEDIGKMIDKAIEITAFCLDIPIDVFFGKTTEKSNAQNDFITFSIDPLKEVIEDTLNATYMDKEDYLNGWRFFVDTTRIMHRDILDAANHMDKLFAQGFSHNEICELIGKVPVDEDWAYERYVTKNYEKGGGINEKILSNNEE